MSRPTRDELRCTVLWCSRMLVGDGGQPFPGPLTVRIAQTEEREAKLIRPRTAAEGLVPPTWVVLGEQADGGVSASELLRVLLSPDEQKLLADLAKHQPCSATSVMERCKNVLGKSEFWAVWGQLQKRELVEQGEDERYRIGPEWLTRWLTKGRS